MPQSLKLLLFPELALCLSQSCFAADICRKAFSTSLSVEICLQSEFDKTRGLEFKVGVTHLITNISMEKIVLVLDDDINYRSRLYIVRDGKAVFSDNRPPVWADDVSIPGTTFHDKLLNPGEAVRLEFKFQTLKALVPKLKSGFGDAANYHLHASTGFFSRREGESSLSTWARPSAFRFDKMRIR